MLLNRPRVRQPFGNIRLGKRNPLRRGLSFCYTPTVGEAFGRPESAITAGGLGAFAVANGVVGRYFGASNAAKFGAAESPINDEVTVFVMFQRTGTLGQYARLFDTKQGGNGLALFLNSGGAGQNAVRVQAATSVTYHDLSGSVADSSKSTLLAVTIKNGLATLYENATSIGSSTSGGGSLTQSVGNQYLIGSESASSIVSPFNGNIYFLAKWARCLMREEILALTNNLWRLYEPRTLVYSSLPSVQYARPTADSITGTWTSSLGGPLYAAIDEVTADDADYIGTTYGSVCEVALGSLADPGVSSGHKVRYRIAADAGAIVVRLRQGTTTIASWTHSPAPTSLTTYEQTLSGAEADSITSYAALKLQFEAY